MANNYGKSEDYVKLTDYIQKIYQESHLEPPWVLLMSQVKYLCKQHNLKYIDLLNGQFNYDLIKEKISNNHYKMIYLQKFSNVKQKFYKIAIL